MYLRLAYVLVVCAFCSISMQLSVSSAYSFDLDCPLYCACNYFNSRLILNCNQSQLNSIFRLPNPHVNVQLVNTTSFMAVRSHLRTFPLNLCDYANMLVDVDMSNNAIVENLNPSHVGCLTNLRYLNLSHNLISFVDANTFNSMQSLQILDLSHNRLTMIPTYLFYLKVPSLSMLYLSHNQLTDVDVWMLWMESIRLVDMSYNHITTIVNRIGWNPYYVATSVKMSESSFVDLSNNRLKSFDDKLLAKFSVCSPSEFVHFMNLFKQFRLTNNPIDCTCVSSYNLLRFYQEYAREHLIPAQFLTTGLFSTRCATPQPLAGLPIFTFINPAVCQNDATAFSTLNCGFLAQSNSSLAKIEKDMLERETIEQLAKATNSPSLVTAQIAVLLSACIALLLMLLILVYCLCPVEILALFFNLTPFLNSICPCKRRANRKDPDSEQDIDLFISYHKSSERWVKNKLVPFAKNNCFLEKCSLHYGSDNRSKEVFGPCVRELMNRSVCTLLVVSSDFLLNEWNDVEFRQHVKNQASKNATRLIFVQMHDVMDEIFEEHFGGELGHLRVDRLHCDEIMFWAKLAFILFTNQPNEVIAPKIHVKPIRNKVHSKQTNESSKPTTSSSSSRPTTSSDKTVGDNNTVESRSVFEVSQAYRGASNLPPLRVSKRLEETMIQHNRKKQGATHAAAVPIVRHSFHEDMIGKCLQTTTAHVEVESTSSGSEQYRRRSKKTRGQDDKPTITTTTKNKKHERRNDTESVEPSNIKSNDLGKARNVSFDIYNIHTQQKRVKPDDSSVFASSDFV